jgi:beta-aspartyl-dipeptidase (metallo-type)
VPPLKITALTAGGITTAIGVLGTDDAVRTTAELVTVTRGLRQLGFSAWCHTGGYHLPPTTLSGTVRGDIALIDEIIGVGEVAISDHRSSQPTLDDLLRLASEAHVGGLMSGKAGIVHLHVGDGTRGLELVRQALEYERDCRRVFNHPSTQEGALSGRCSWSSADRRSTSPHSPWTTGRIPGPPRCAGALLGRRAAGKRVTVSSDGGGCLPRFDSDGRVAGMDVGAPARSWT